MKIVQVGKFYPPEYQGGLESVVVGINDELVRRGVGVTVVVAAVGAGGLGEHRGVRVIRVPAVANVFSQPLTPGFGRAVRAAAGDILHLHHPNPVGDLAVRSDPRPLVITQHSDIVRQRMLRPFYMPLLRSVFQRARRIAVGSEQLLATSTELKGFEPKARVIPYGIDASGFALTDAVRARAEELRAAWGPRPVILAVGRLVGYKGFDVLLKAAADLDATVVIVGKGPEEARLRALAGLPSTQHPAPSTRFPAPSTQHPAPVLFAGRVSDQDLVAHYHACDIFCLPSVSIAEAFGMVLLEAMACGKPLVSTALPTGVSAVNRDGTTGLVVPPGNVGALREALKTLLGDEGLRKAMGEAGRQVQATEYTASLMGERYLKLYEESL